MAASKPKSHHVREELCTTRAKYREGRQLTAVKVGYINGGAHKIEDEWGRQPPLRVYTVAEESRYLLVQGIPAVSAHNDLVKLFAIYGTIDEYRILDDYPHGDFEEVMWIKFQRIQSARIAKKKMDDYNFFGGSLHVCYAPEFESVQDTREKLQDRRKAIAARIQKLNAEKGSSVQAAHKDGQSQAQPISSKQIQQVQQFQGDKTMPSGFNAGSAGSIPPDQASLHPAYRDTQRQKSEQSTHNPPGIQGSQYQHMPPGSALPQSANQCSYRETQLPPPVQSHNDNTNLPPTLPRELLPPPSHHSSSDNSQAQFQQYYRKKLGGDFSMSSKHQNIKDEKIADNAGVIQVNEKLINKLVVRTVTPKVKAKFIPRQVAHKNIAIKKTGVLKKEEIQSDPVLETLKMNATTLGKLAGPTLPVEEEDKRKTFISSDTGDQSLDKSSAAIREKVKQFSAVAVPLQVKMKRKVERADEPVKKLPKTS